MASDGLPARVKAILRRHLARKPSGVFYKKTDGIVISYGGLIIGRGMLLMRMSVPVVH